MVSAMVAYQIDLHLLHGKLRPKEPWTHKMTAKILNEFSLSPTKKATKYIINKNKTMSPVDEQEYKDHKIHCSENSNSLGLKMDSLELAMYGREDLEIKGVLQMTKEMHAAFIGSGFTFKTLLKILAFIAALGAASTFI